MSSSSAAATATREGTEVIIDLTADEWEAVYTPAHIVTWLRNSDGTLGERAMKRAAADLIEARGRPRPHRVLGAWLRGRGSRPVAGRPA